MFSLCKLHNSVARIISNTTRCSCSYEIALGSCLNQPHLFTHFFPLVFPSILLHIFLVAIVLTVPVAVSILVISWLFQSSTLLLIGLSKSLVIALLFDAPTVWNALPDEFCASPSLASFRKQNTTYLAPSHTLTKLKCYLAPSHTLTKLKCCTLHYFSMPIRYF